MQLFSSFGVLLYIFFSLKFYLFCDCSGEVKIKILTAVIFSLLGIGCIVSKRTEKPPVKSTLAGVRHYPSQT